MRERERERERERVELPTLECMFDVEEEDEERGANES